jgi:hypothetical protein
MELENAGAGLTVPRKQVATLAPLEAARIGRFLDQLDRVGIDVTHVRLLLEHERTPLMTDVILQTYEGKPEDYLRQAPAADVWQNYVARKFEDEKARREASGTPLPYAPAKTMQWLAWVARNLRVHTRDQHRFFVEELHNQGIIDSGRIGVIVAAGGVVAGLLFGLAIGVPCYFGIGFKASTGHCVSGALSSLLSGLRFGLGMGAILGLIAGQILGGFAWLRHYLTRTLLYLNQRQIPWRIEQFLAYATKMNLLRRVGGGFEFIDQELQSYFEEASP